VKRGISEIFGKDTPLGRATSTDGFAGEGAAASAASFVVDGVTISAAQDGPRLRLSCIVAEHTPADEGALRRLLSQFLAYADHGHAVLCCDNQGRMLLVEEIDRGPQVEELAAEFFDAAVHWTKTVRTLGTTSEIGDLRVAVIYP
jgi:hypothetical protein